MSLFSTAIPICSSLNPWSTWLSNVEQQFEPTMFHGFRLFFHNLSCVKSHCFHHSWWFNHGQSPVFHHFSWTFHSFPSLFTDFPQLFSPQKGVPSPPRPAFFGPWPWPSPPSGRSGRRLWRPSGGPESRRNGDRPGIWCFWCQPQWEIPSGKLTVRPWHSSGLEN